MPRSLLWLLVLVVAALIAVAVLAVIAVVGRRVHRERDRQRWEAVFAQRNPKVASGQARTTDTYDEQKAVAGHRRWQRETATGRVLRSVRAIRRAEHARHQRATVTRIDEHRRQAGGQS